MASRSFSGGFGLFGLLLVITQAALAADPPGWTTTHPKQDTFFRYFKGVSEPSISPAEAITLAEEAARRAAVQECFGVQVSGSSSAIETGRDRGFTRSIVTQTKKVQLNRFERVDEWIRELGSSGKYEATLLFRYPKQEEERERLRLDSGRKADADPSLWMSAEGGDVRTPGRGTLKVSSDPPDAEVWIDDIRWGTTPIQLTGRIDPGEHRLRLESPFHESKVLNFVLNRDQTLPFHVVLERRKAAIKIDTNYSDALVEVVGQFKERAPTRAHILPEGLEIEVRVTHRDAFPLVKKTIVPPQPNPDEPVGLNFQLEGRPAYVVVTCSDEEAEISLERTTLGLCKSVTGRVFPWPAGRDLTVVATRAGYIPLSKTVRLIPDRTIRVKLETMEREPEPQPYSAPMQTPWHLTAFDLDQKWVLGMGFGPTGVADTWSLPFFVEFRLLNGLSVGYEYDWCAGPKYKGGGSGLYGKIHFSENLYAGYFGYAESISLTGQYDDFNTNSYLLFEQRPWYRDGYGYGLGYESYPSGSGSRLGGGYRLGLRQWNQGSQEFSGNLWMGVRF